MNRESGTTGRRRSTRSWTGKLESLEERQLLAIDVTTYALPMVLQSTPTSITKGPDGNLWMTESGASKIAKIAPNGQVLQEFDINVPLGTALGSITSGPGDALYFSSLTYDANSNAVGKISRITTSGQVTDFPIELGATVASITSGSDGNIWFTENLYNNGASGQRIGRMTPDGQIATFAVPGASGYFGTIVSGTDGNLWFTDTGNTNVIPSSKIGRITTSGVATEFPLSNSNAYLNGLTVGPDGNIWFAESSYTPSTSASIGKITPEGQITEYALPTDGSAFPNQVVSLSPGSDGNVWFSQYGRVGKITPTGQITSALVPSQSTYGNIQSTTLGPDGNVWFTESDYATTKLGQVTPALAITEFAIPPSYTTDSAHGLSVSPNNIVRGVDGALWFSTTTNHVVEVRRMATDGTVATYPVSQASDSAYPTGLARGADGNIWFSLGTSAGGQIGKISPTGTVTKFSTPGTVSPAGIVAGSDGNLWAVGTDAKSKVSILRITTAGVIKSRAVPKNVSLTGPLLSGPNGKIWAAATRQTSGRRAATLGEVVMINPTSGKFTEIVLPKAPSSSGPIGLANVKATADQSSASTSTTVPISTTSGSSLSRVVASPTSPLPGADATSSPSKVSSTLPLYYSNYYQAQSMTVGPDGNVWIAASANGTSRIIRMTPRGKMTSYDVPNGALASTITTGPDGNVWFSANQQYFYPLAAADLLPYPYPSKPAQVGRITPGGAMTLFTLPKELTNVSSITTGPDGNLWVTDANDSRVAKFTPPSLFSGTIDTKDIHGLAPNVTNDTRPTFHGVAHPYAHIRLFAKGPNDSEVSIGSSKADAAGNWTLETSKPLPDGSYQVQGGETSADGFFYTSPIPLTPLSDNGPLVIDTTSPRISSFGYNASTHSISINIQDAGAGFSIPNTLTNYAPVLSDLSNYKITYAGSKTPLNFTVSLGAGTTASSANVVLTLDSAPYGVTGLTLTVNAKGLVDQAGNQLDGEFRGGKLPSGNGKAGGNFVATIHPQAKA